jgi:hypothetical protein
VIPYDIPHLSDIDDLAGASDVEYIQLFMDGRRHAILTPRGSGLRGANGNGSFFVYEWSATGWRFMHEFGGYEYELQPDPKTPLIVGIERVSRDTLRRTEERWNGTRFEIVSREEEEYPGE